MHSVLHDVVHGQFANGDCIPIHVSYAWTPSKCSGCTSFGHNVYSCPTQKNKPVNGKVSKGTE